MQKVSEDKMLEIVSRILSNRKDEVAWNHFAISSWPTVLAATRQLNIDLNPREVHAEVMVRLFRHAKLANFATGSGIRAYIRVVVQSIGANHRKVSRPHIDPLDDESPETVVVQPAERTIMGELIRSLKHHLEDQEIKLVELLLRENTSRREMAMQLQITEGYLASQISRLKARIRNLLEKNKNF